MIKEKAPSKRKNQIAALWKENKPYLPWIASILILFIVIDFISNIDRPGLVSRVLSNNYTIWYLTVIIIPIGTINCIYLFKQLLGQYFDSQIKLLLLKTFALIVGVILTSLLMESIALAMGVPDNDDTLAIGQYEFSYVVTNLVSNTTFALVIGVPVFFLHANKAENKMTVERQQMELERLEKLQIQSELDALQAKINPHFLYNSLNSIASLIHESPDKAEQMVLSLSDLFRYSVNRKNENYTSIEEELKMVTTYLNIELVRFEDQLEFELYKTEGIDQHTIPKFIIQPLIENAIKHGTSKVMKGKIKLNLIRKEDDLKLSLYDNGPDFPENIDAGYGVQSTVDKLDLLYNGRYKFQLLNSPEKHVFIEFKNLFKDA